MVLFFNCYVVLHFLFFFLLKLCKFKIYSVKFGKQSFHLFGKDLPTLLGICSFCGCSIVFVCLSLSFGAGDLLSI